MLNVGSISSHKKQFINEASILRLRPYVIDEIGEDESFYLYQQCQKLLYHAFSRNMSNEVALVYTVKEHEEGNYILGTQTNTDLESDTKTQQILNKKDDNICILLHNHPTDLSFSIEDFAEFLLYGKLKVMVAITNSGEQYFMTKTSDYDRKKAVKKLIEISKICDHNNDGKLTRSESVQAAKQFEKVAYAVGIRIE
ncbi:MAG: hypothetical protein J6B26_02995 [Agathobacter sp.]|nr:hypothetical protein [Agathobacter sp.]